MVGFCPSAPGRACLHRLGRGRPLVGPDVGAWGIRLGGLLRPRTGLARVGGASEGTQHPVTRQVAEAIVRSRHEERARRAQARPATAITGAKEATVPGGRGLGAADPKSTALVVEQAAPARDHDPWQARLEQALAGRHCQVSQATREAAPGWVAYVEHPRGAPHSPDVFPGPQALGQAVCGPMAPTPRAAAQAAREAHERFEHGHGHRPGAGDLPAQPGAGPPPPALTSPEPLAQDAPGARQECERLSAQRAPGAQRRRRLGQASHVGAVERGVRRNGRRSAADIRAPIATLRPGALPAGRRQPCLARREPAERVVPHMQATIAGVSGSGHQPGRPTGPAPACILRPTRPSHALVRAAPDGA